MPVSELEGDNMQAYINKEGQTALSALNTYSALENGTFTVNGETITTDDVADILIEQADLMFADMENAKNNQGIISKGISFFNDIFGFGTSESEMQTQVEHYKDMVQNLANCSSPADFAAMYKSITGRDFDVSNLSQLLAYDSMQNPEETTSTAETEANTPAEGDNEQISLDEVVNSAKNCAVDEEGNANPDILLQTGNSRAQESIQDYISTQNTAKEAVNGVITGVVAAAAVAAAPFTGGASLLLAAGVGAATNMGLNAVDSVYDADGDGTLDINYTAGEMAGDAIVGAFSGISGVGAAKAGGAVTKALSANTGGTNAAINLATRMAGETVEGFVDGSISSGADYMGQVVQGDVVFDVNELGERMLTGGAIGSVTNVGINRAGDMVSFAGRHLGGDSANTGELAIVDPDSMGPDGTTGTRTNNNFDNDYDTGKRTGAGPFDEDTNTNNFDNDYDTGKSAGADNTHESSTADNATDGADGAKTETGANADNTNAHTATDNAPDYLKTDFSRDEVRSQAQKFVDEINASDNPKKAYRRISQLIHPDTSGASAQGIQGSFGEEILKLISFDSQSGFASIN